MLLAMGVPGGEHHTPAVERLDVPHLPNTCRTPLARGLRQTRDARHLGDVKQVLK